MMGQRGVKEELGPSVGSRQEEGRKWLALLSASLLLGGFQQEQKSALCPPSDGCLGAYPGLQWQLRISPFAVSACSPAVTSFRGLSRCTEGLLYILFWYLLVFPTEKWKAGMVVLWWSPAGVISSQHPSLLRVLQHYALTAPWYLRLKHILQGYFFPDWRFSLEIVSPDGINF